MINYALFVSGGGRVGDNCDKKGKHNMGSVVNTEYIVLRIRNSNYGENEH